jgi:uncharacterized SAM-binding protein YcdF (DUF218 family)
VLRTTIEVASLIHLTGAPNAFRLANRRLQEDCDQRRGGSGTFNFLIGEGIPHETIVAEWRSTITHENAIEMTGLIQNMAGKKVLLTSDFYMYRALRVFRKLGIEVTPMAVPDVLHSVGHWNGRFSAFEIMVVESAKIADYDLRGWI